MRKRQGGFILIALAFFALACSTWRTVQQPPAEYLALDSFPLRLQIIGDGWQETLANPYVVADSLVGTIYTDGVTRRKATPLAAIRSIRVRHTSAAGVVGVLFLLGGLAALIGGAASMGGISSGPSSCPTVYSWTETGWRLESGTFAGALMRSLQRTDVDNLDFVTPNGQTLRLRVTNERAEVDHLDAVRVFAVDHDDQVVVAPDPHGHLHGLRDAVPPLTAVDLRGGDVFQRVRRHDSWSWFSNPAGRDSSRAADVRDGLILKFLRPRGASTAHLIVDGRNTTWAASLLWEWVAARGAGTQAWYDSLNADPAAARRAFLPIAREALLTASISTSSGFVPFGQFGEVGPEIDKRQVLHFEIPSNAGDTIVIRLETVPGLWSIEQVGMAFGDDAPFVAQKLPLRQATTPAGLNLMKALAEVDGDGVTLVPGEQTDLVFEVPPTQEGRIRSFILHSTGWYELETPRTGPGDPTMIHRIAMEPLALSRIAVGRLNEGLASLRESSERSAPGRP
jgi:hypothetical protein